MFIYKKSGIDFSVFLSDGIMEIEFQENIFKCIFNQNAVWTKIHAALFICIDVITLSLYKIRDELMKCKIHINELWNIHTFCVTS